MKRYDDGQYKTKGEIMARTDGCCAGDKPGIGDYKHKIMTFAVMQIGNRGKETVYFGGDEKMLAEFMRAVHFMNISTIPMEQCYILINCSLNEAEGFAKKFNAGWFFFGKNNWQGKCVNVTRDCTTRDCTTRDTDNTTAVSMRFYRMKNGKAVFECVDKIQHIRTADRFDAFFCKHKAFEGSIYRKIFDEEYETLRDISDHKLMEQALNATNRKAMCRSMMRYNAYHGKY